MDDSPSKRQISRTVKSSPTTPSKAEGGDGGIWELSKEEAIERVVELESELFEFQESSKDLEQALEHELHNLELANEKIEYKYTMCLEQLNIANAKVVSLTNEITSITDKNRSTVEELNQKVNDLRTQLVSVEIVNDNMETNDRVLENKLEIANLFNGELLEKVAMLENDYERERKNAIERQLHLSNAENEIRQLKLKYEAGSNGDAARKRISSYPGSKRNSLLVSNGSVLTTNGIEQPDDGEEAGDVSILSMRDILRSGPPILRVPAIPKSNSLKKLHELTEKSGALSEKVQNFKTALVPGGLKSPSTTQLSKQNSLKRINSWGRRSSEERRRVHSTSSSLSTIKGRISPSPSIMNLAQISQGDSESTRLHTIEGSPAAKSDYTLAKKKTRKGSILDSLKAIGI